MQYDKQNLFTARYHYENGLPLPEAAIAELKKVVNPILGVPSPGDSAIVPGEDVEPDPPVIGDPGPVLPGMFTDKRVALIVGHNARQPGAYIGPRSEFDYNGEVASILAGFTGGPEYKVFNRYYHGGSYYREINECYDRVNLEHFDLCVEMHFNGDGADYCMMIYAQGSTKGGKVCIPMLDVFSNRLGIPKWKYGNPPGCDERGTSENGGRGLLRAKAVAVMTEPFFGDNDKHREKVLELGTLRVAEIYDEAIKAGLAALVAA